MKRAGGGVSPLGDVETGSARDLGHREAAQTIAAWLMRCGASSLAARVLAGEWRRW